MNILVIDFETYYGKDFSLMKGKGHTKMSAYVRHKTKFKIHCMAAKLNDKDIECFTSNEDIKSFLFNLDASKTILICQNAKFDGLILAHHFNWYPRMYVDTMGMAQALIGNKLKSVGLKSLAEYYQLPLKGDELALSKDKRELTDEEMESLCGYCKNDVLITSMLFLKLKDYLPPKQYHVMDWTIRMFTQPRLLLDTKLLKKIYDAEVKSKQTFIDSIDEDPADIRSTDKFAELIKACGAIPPTKSRPPSKVEVAKAREQGVEPQPKQIYAFAKTDKEFARLREHGEYLADMGDGRKEYVKATDVDRVKKLCEARLSAKSTITDSRAEAYMKAAKDGPWCVDLRFSGAHTHRLSGGDGGGGNPQNLPRVGEGETETLRHAIVAPEGHKFIVADLAGIEMRCVMYMAKQQDVIDVIEEGGDIYCNFAREVYNKEVTKADKEERMVGKVGMLSLQYLTGAETFAKTVWQWTGKEISLDEAKHVVNTYRAKMTGVKELWNEVDNAINIMHNPSFGREGYTPIAPFLTVEKDAIVLPSGLRIKYPDMRQISTEEYEKIFGRTTWGPQWVFTNMKPSFRPSQIETTHKGKVTENIVQAVANCIITDQIMEINKSYPTVMQVHDEVIVLVKDEQVEEAKEKITEIMTKPIPWWPNLKLGISLDVGQTYGDAK